VAAGVRRIEAITGENAFAWVTAANNTLNHLAKLLKTTPQQLEERTHTLLEQIRTQDKELQRLKGKLASSQGDDLTAQAVEIQGIKVLATQLEGVETKQLRDILDQLKNKLGSAVIVLATVQDNKVGLIAGVTADLTAKLKAGDLINHVAKQVGGKGGGRADMAQAGGTEPANLKTALASVAAWVDNHR
jgi:alanyl-tRNA synthetase